MGGGNRSVRVSIRSATGGEMSGGKRNWQTRTERIERHPWYPPHCPEGLPCGPWRGPWHRCAASAWLRLVSSWWKARQRHGREPWRSWAWLHQSIALATRLQPVYYKFDAREILGRRTSQGHGGRRAGRGEHCGGGFEAKITGRNPVGRLFECGEKDKLREGKGNALEKSSSKQLNAERYETKRMEGAEASRR